MRVHCNKCNYESEHRPTADSLAEKVNDDSGRMNQSYDKDGTALGWYVRCPNGHDGAEIHLDWTSGPAVPGAPGLTP